MYRERRNKSYLATRKWASKAYREMRRHGKVRRHIITYEAIVKGEHVIDKLAVIAKTEKEALLKARNIAKSFHPKAKSIAVTIDQEQWTLKTQNTKPIRI
jgi:hypothetical protein